MLFTQFGLSDSILRAITESGYTTPTPIQIKSIPAVMKGGDLLAAAQTGTGKTAGFTLPILQRLINSKSTSNKREIRALILTPTRELAAQVHASVQTYGKFTDLKSAVIFGGVGANPQIKSIQSGLDILVATPGRLLDLIQQKFVSLNSIEILVLDEADRMLDMGFLRDIKKILGVLPKNRQNLLFSATFSSEIKALADTLLNSPTFIEAEKNRGNTTNEAITQLIHPVNRNEKRALLTHLIKKNHWEQVLVFTRTKHGANKLATQLGTDGINSMAIHGNKSQSARTKALADFKGRKITALVATDIAARGIDIDQLPHVVNYDLPNIPEDYVHRIGRTGRAGSNGIAVSLVCVDEHEILKDIEKLIRQSIPKEVVKGFEPDLNAIAQPIQLRSNQFQNTNQKPRKQTPQLKIPSSSNINHAHHNGAVKSSPPKKPRQVG